MTEVNKEAVQEQTKQPVVKDEKNGVTRPAANTATGKIWAIIDHLSTVAGEPAARKDVLAMCEKEGLNLTTAATQHGRWRRYHGLVQPSRAKKKEVQEDIEVGSDE